MSEITVEKDGFTNPDIGVHGVEVRLLVDGPKGKAGTCVCVSSSVARDLVEKDLAELTGRRATNQ